MTDALALRQVPGRVPAPRPPVISDAALVGAKLSRPEVPPGYVDRPRLRAALDAGTRGPVGRDGARRCSWPPGRQRPRHPGASAG